MGHQHDKATRIGDWIVCCDCVLPFHPLMALEDGQGCTVVSYSDGRRVRTRTSLEELFSVMSQGIAVSLGLTAESPTEQEP